jgi:crossover junction endodeoxyribonuclease RuvC
VLDPGLRHTGWVIIETSGNSLRYIAHGVVTSHASDTLSDRLTQLYQGLQKMIGEYLPKEAAVEETFVNKNPVSTLKLGMARGVVLLAPAPAGHSVVTADAADALAVAICHAHYRCFPVPTHP